MSKKITHYVFNIDFEKLKPKIGETFYSNITGIAPNNHIQHLKELIVPEGTYLAFDHLAYYDKQIAKSSFENYKQFMTDLLKANITKISNYLSDQIQLSSSFEQDRHNLKYNSLSIVSEKSTQWKNTYFRVNDSKNKILAITEYPFVYADINAETIFTQAVDITSKLSDIDIKLAIRMYEMFEQYIKKEDQC